MSKSTRFSRYAQNYERLALEQASIEPVNEAIRRYGITSDVLKTPDLLQTACDLVLEICCEKGVDLDRRQIESLLKSAFKSSVGVVAFKVSDWKGKEIGMLD